MEQAKYLQLLYRYRLLLIAVPIIAVLVTYLLVRKTPDMFLSQTNISTGFIDATKQVLANSDDVLQDTKIEAQFSSLIETIQLGKVLDQVSYQLIIHDLTNSVPFHPYSTLLNQLNPSARAHALKVFTDRYENREPLNLAIPDEAGLKSVLVSQKYDAQSIRSQLTIYRTENSDFVHLDYKSEQPLLSAFVLNTLCVELIAYTNSDERNNKTHSNDFLRKLVQQKQDTMNAKIAELQNYKVNNHILNLKDESTGLYTQLSDYQNRKALAEKDVFSYNSAIANIDSRFDPSDRKYLEASEIKINDRVAQTRDRLAAANDKYIDSNFAAEYKKNTDSLQNALDAQLTAMSDKYVSNPLAGKEYLVQEKVKMEIARDMAKSALRKLDMQIGQLNGQLDHNVPFDAVIQSFERDIDVSTKEYLDAQNRYNQSSIESNLSSTLKQVETAMPGTRQPSKKFILVAASGLVALVFCLIVLFIIYFLDKEIRLPAELANATQIPVLGQLNQVVKSPVDYKRIGQSKQSTNELQHFKNLLRSIRYEIDNEVQEQKCMECGVGNVLAITSMNPKEGKSLLCMSLASAYAMANKKVLVVDGNFDNPSVTKIALDITYLEDFLNDEDSFIQSQDDSLITVLGTRGGDYSLLEKSEEAIVRNKINLLKKSFDVIIIETQALSLLNKAKEWIHFADNVVAVFEANQTITSEKQLYINYLRTLNSKFIGLIMNKVDFVNELEATPV